MGHEFDFESVGVLQVGGVVVGIDGVGVAVGEQQDSAVVCRLGREGIDHVRIADVEGEVVETGSASVVVGGAEGG